MTKIIMQFILSMKLGLELIINHFLDRCERGIAGRKSTSNSILAYYQTFKITIVMILLSLLDKLDEYFVYTYLIDSG